MRKNRVAGLALLAVALTAAAGGIPSREAWRPGSRVLLDAHNCYPYFEWWNDRIDRALSAGTPLAIEQDLLWTKDPRSGQMRSLLSHGAPATGGEPGMREYFFERVRPLVEKARSQGNRGDWPLITLNLDLKSEEPQHLAAIWQLLSEYKDWITSAPKGSSLERMESLDIRPILVLTGESEAQKAVFYDQLPAGGRLLVFGAVKTDGKDPAAPAEVIEPRPADNYHRWWNNSWQVVEPRGQPAAGEWTEGKAARLKSLVRHAHANNLWIRFYTLDGAAEAQLSCKGWFRSYNFGSLAAARRRWRAAQEAGADFIASDQYEELGAFLKSAR